MLAEPRFTRLFTELLLRVFMTLNVSLFPHSPDTLWESRRCFRWANECRRPIGCHIAYFLSPRLHFAVPGADSDGGVDGEGDGDRASDWPMRFPSRKDQFLDFVSLSKWLLEQLSGGGGFTLAATGAPVTECAGILQACQVCPFIGRLVGQCARMARL